MIRANNPNYRAALATSHGAYSRVEVWRSGIKVEELTATAVPAVQSLASVQTGAPVFVTGSVRATLTSRVSRVLTLTVPDWLFPWDPTDLLAPWGNELRAFRGVQYGTGEQDEFPVFRGPIVNVRPAGGGAVTVTANDRAQQVVGSGFAAPALAAAGTLITTEFRRVVRGALPDATFGTFGSFTALVPALSYDYDRGAALDGLAAVVGGLWYPLAGGDFVLRSVPWSVPITIEPLLMTNVGGTLLTAQPIADQSAVFNRVTVSNEPTDGTPPSHATVDDTDPASPTYILGPFGVKATQIRVTQATNQQGCRIAAQAVLARSKGLAGSWALTCVPDGSIELGDPLDIEYLDTSNIVRSTVQLVAGFTLPLDVQATMSIDGRAPQ